MQSSEFNMPEVDMAFITQGASLLDRGNFYRFKDEGTTWLFLLPPFGRGKIAKEVFECYGLPGKKRWVGWETWKYIDPMIMDDDPVTTYLTQLAAAGHEEAAKMLPSCKYYANGILFHTQATEGEVKSFHTEPELRTFCLPISAWTGICNLWAQPMYADPKPVHPASAVLLQVQRSGKGMQTRYTVSAQMGTDFQPLRYDLFTQFGDAVMRDILSKIPDLDKRWSPPGDAEAVEAKDIVRGLKAKFDSVGFGQVPGQQAGPMGSSSFGGPPAPSGPPTAAPSMAPPAPVSLGGGVNVAPVNPVQGGPPEAGIISDPAGRRSGNQNPAPAAPDTAPVPTAPTASPPEAPAVAGLTIPDADPLPAPEVTSAVAVAAAQAPPEAPTINPE